jgi:hypothetical protein
MKLCKNLKEMQASKHKEVEIQKILKRKWKKIRKLHAQILFWKPNSINVLWWAFYYVNNNNEIDVIAPQVMHCILYYNSPINPKTQTRKGLII